MILENQNILFLFHFLTIISKLTHQLTCLFGFFSNNSGKQFSNVIHKTESDVALCWIFLIYSIKVFPFLNTYISTF